MKTASLIGIVAALLLAVAFILAPPAPAEEGAKGASGPACANPDTIDDETADRLFKKVPYSPYADRNFPSRVYWGDTHVHTGYSMDAGAFGCRLDPNDAHRFARGEQLISSTGQPVRLSRPLDFLVVADHSDNMGFFPRLFGGDPAMLADETGRRWYDMIQQGGAEGVKVAVEVIESFSAGTFPPALASTPGSYAYRKAWEDTVKAAETYNEPGTYTAFIGYEWTSNTDGNNLHRVVIYRDDKYYALREVPYTTIRPIGSDDPRDLWKWMAAYEEKTGGQVLAIAHNGNLSNGIMFPIVDSFTGKDVGKDYCETRARWEPLYEATQIKGDGEAHPLLSPDDAFADYETWDKGNLTLTVPKTDDMLPFEYARSGLQVGLQLEQKFGVNPYKFGMIGSTDTHTALATAEEDNFFGKHSGVEPGPNRWEHPVAEIGQSRIDAYEMAASGYAGVWASENTREALFDAMMRKETYATTGPRMIVRFFGGYDFDAADARSRSPAKAGYTKGVPMGGDMLAAPAGKSPSFLVAALKDPIGANLDRIQIVKGWIDAQGNRQEKVFDVVWSGDRVAGADGKVPAVGNTVDLATATWTNSIGAPELIAVWSDPTFDPSVHAFYYARVLEIPTPRWTAYDAYRYGVKMPETIPMITQERAYTSPIWYTPEK